MSSNGQGPRRRAPRRAISRRLRLAVGAGAALLIVAALVSPVVLSGSGGSHAKSCSPTLRYGGRVYIARRVPPQQVVEVTAIGVGLANDCGAAPANIDLRSLAGITPADAVGVTADPSSIYVRRGVCPRSSPDDLVACLRKRR